MRYNKIIFCGIGGSGMPGEVISCLNLKTPVFLAREQLPKWANRNTLCFIVSYSGNTKETINLYKQAKKKKCKIVIITSGGKLGTLKEEIIFIPEGYMPRDALFIMLRPIFKVLKLRFKELSNKRKKQASNVAQMLSKKLKGKHPVIYVSSEKLKCVGYRWEDQLSEDSKIFSEVNFFPELVHNDIESRKEKNYQIVFLVDKETKQMKKAEKILKPIKIKLQGTGFLEKMFYGIYMGDKLGESLAKLKGIDYKKTLRIDKIKNDKKK
jgi:glucose/mannose-6-phosphate isomerase